MQAGRVTPPARERFRSGCVACVLLAPILASGAVTHAQSNGAIEIRRSTIDGGGGLVGTGGIGLTSTLGQHDAARSRAGAVELRGGFWAATATRDDELFANGFE